MPYRPPLIAREYFVADPPELPVRRHGEGGLARLARAEVVATDGSGVTLKGVTSTEESLVVQVSAAGDGIIRVKLSEQADARTRSARALKLTRPVESPAEVTIGDETVVVDAGAVRAEIRLNPWNLRFTDPSGRTLTEQDPGRPDISGRLRTLPFGRSQTDGVTVAYHETFLVPADEAFTGFGESFTPLDKRGQRPLMWNFDAFGAESQRAYKNVPFYLSSRGYGIVVDSGMPVEFDMCQSTHSDVQIVVPDDLIDYYVLGGPKPADVLRRLHALTGPAVLPPKWALGSWISSGFFRDSQERVLDRARKIRERGIPCDVLHLDTFWQIDGHWSDLRWDRDAFPDPEGMLSQLDEQGFKVCLWMNPYISHLSPCFEEAASSGYLLLTRDGEAYVADAWHGSYPACGIVDFTNPAARTWFRALLKGLLEQGVQVFKTDFAEGVPANAVAYNGMTGTELHNVYSLMFNDLVAEVTREVAGHGLVWARSSYLGGQRHPAQWSGDVDATYPAMGSTIRGGLSHGLSGIAFWSHDAGGFTGTPTPDLFVRWAQFGALSPLVRFHGTTSREPWEFPEHAERGAVEALRLRYRLMPYLYSTAIEAVETGLPIMRALCVDQPNDPVSWQADLEYLLGPDLLVAPMTAADGTRDVYLPSGTWVDHWTGEHLTGGRHIRVSPPLDRIPLYGRLGALIPTTATAGVTVTDSPEISLLVYGLPDGESRTVVRDDDGETVVTAVHDRGRLVVRAEGPKTVVQVEIVGGSAEIVID
ncbi:TIM-barrel domain-containing protein [Herbidospora mongoliensis]|uniref:TIM-barrel domain-containing protein n=1 Tax=Herbidospora mongoliensis TaxID=688067 RepID=UPI00082FF69A|nr:TIM-barrel domain-containing protein [Herbidospora mongoliensis]